jgi:hypothetical protein
MNRLRQLVKETLQQRNVKKHCCEACRLKIKEELKPASKLYEIDGILVIDTDAMFHKQVMSDIRAITGITIVKDYIYDPAGGSENRGYATLSIKIDPAPFENKNATEITTKVIEDIKRVRGVRAFKLKKGPISIEL